MTQNIRILLLTLAIWVSRDAQAWSQDRLPASPKILGRILVMEGDRCLEGNVEAVDDQYCVRKGMSEVWISGKKVLRVCADWTGAYRYMKQRANLDDPDERLRIARWCQRYNMLTEALLEAKTAQDLRPLHTETRHLVAVLKGTLAAARTTPAPMEPAVEPIDNTPSPDITPEAAAYFATKIQPILINTCVSCHSGGRGGEFQLFRTSEGGHRTALQRNLKSVLSQIRFDSPTRSPLLIKAISPHGPTVSSPLPGKKSVPYQSVEAWVEGLVANHPHLREQARARMPAEPMGDPNAFAATNPDAGDAALPPGFAPKAPDRPMEAAPPVFVTPNTKKDTGGIAIPLPKLKAAPVPAAEPALPMAPARPMPSLTPAERDEYSAEEFNRGAHPPN